MAQTLTALMVYAACSGDEEAQDGVIATFNTYVKGWANREVISGKFIGSSMDADDLANMLRERIWMAIEKFDMRRSKKDIVTDFTLLAKSYMAAGMWHTRKHAHRHMRMPKVVVKKEFDEKMVRNAETGKLTVTRVANKGGQALQSCAAERLNPIGLDGSEMESDRMIEALRVRIDFDLNIHLDRIRVELGKRDALLSEIFDMLIHGLALDEIAQFIGTSADYIADLITREIKPVALVHVGV